MSAHDVVKARSRRNRPGPVELPDNYHFRVLAKLQSRPPHTGRVALYLTLIGLGWLLAAASGMLWLRENPGRRMRRRDSPKRSWRFNALYFAAIVLTAYGGSGIQRHQHSESFWIVVAVAVIPLVLLSVVIPRRCDGGNSDIPQGNPAASTVPPKSHRTRSRLRGRPLAQAQPVAFDRSLRSRCRQPPARRCAVECGVKIVR